MLFEDQFFLFLNAMRPPIAATGTAIFLFFINALPAPFIPCFNKRPDCLLNGVGPLLNP